MSSEGLRKITHNIGWLFLDKILRMGVGLVVGVWVARYLGPKQYGLWNYAIAFTSLFGAFATLGLDSIVIRDIVKEPSRRDELLGSAFWMKLMAAVLTCLLTVTIIQFLKRGDRLALYLVALSSIGFIFQSTNVIDFYFQSQVRSKYTVYAQNSAFVLVALVKIVLLLSKAPLLAFAIAGAIEIGLGSLFMIFFYTRNHLSIWNWGFSGKDSIQLIRNSWPIILTDMAIMVYMRIDQVMIGQMLGEREVGIYSAAVKLSEIWYFIPMAIVSSLYPAIIESKKQSMELYLKRVQQLYTFMVWMALSIAIPMTFLSEWVVAILFGDAFREASNALSISIWSGVFVFYTVARSKWILVENYQIYSNFYIISGLMVNVLLNFLLIPTLGISGAAWSALFAQMTGAIIAPMYHKKVRISVIMFFRSFSIVNLLGEKKPK
jgi:polysaccharide transporter, PST family